MSRKAKKKKHLDENGEKPPEDLLFYFDNVPDVIIYGKRYLRIPYDGSAGASCPGCHCEIKALHRVACGGFGGQGGEFCPLCKGLAVTCPCSPNIEDAEKDYFIECLERQQIWYPKQHEIEFLV